MQPIPIAIVSNGMPPYRLHVHRRIVRELPQIKLFSILTHDDGSGRWDIQIPEEIGLQHFGPGESSSLQAKPSRALHEWRKGGRIIRFLKDEAVRAVIINGYNDAGRLRLIRWCHRHRLRCFISADSNIRGDHASGAKLLVKRALLGWIMRSVSGVLPCGSLGREFFLKYGAKPDRIWLYPVEPDYDLIVNVGDEVIAEARSRHGLDPNRRRLVFSGRLVEDKRVDLLIDAFNSLADGRTDWDLVIVGDGVLRESLQRRVRSDLSHRVIWAGYDGNPTRIAAIYRCCDALVLPSDYEPWALVVNEAAAAGLALVCSDVVGAAAELLRDGANGRSFQAGDIGSLCEAILDVTDQSRIDDYRCHSNEILREWRERADPIDGLAQALRHTSLLESNELIIRVAGGEH